MWRGPLRTCNGPIPKSTKQVIPNNLYRSGLGVAISPEVKKCPAVIYRPGVGYQQPRCCLKPVKTITLRILIAGGTPFASGLKIIDGNGSAVIIDGGKP
jgi:hypothetical protein